jgi:AcrR family transcriptional regulator
MPSPLSSRRVPQQPRGSQRVSELLDAAGEVIVEVGYEATTMTAIAERARASIGCVYQYFPNKEALTRALRALYGDKLEQILLALEQRAPALSVTDLASALVAIMADFMREHPCYLPLLAAPATYRRDPNARQRLREGMARMFRSKNSQLPHPVALRMAHVTLQILKGLNTLYSEADATEQSALIEEHRVVLRAYLEVRLG